MYIPINFFDSLIKYEESQHGRAFWLRFYNVLLSMRFVWPVCEVANNELLQQQQQKKHTKNDFFYRKE